MANAGPTVSTYSTDLVLASCTGGAIGLNFGFNATQIRICNDAGVPVRFQVASTGLATTNDVELKVGEQYTGFFYTYGMGVMTTSTTTSTDGTAHRVRVQAWTA